MTTVTCPAGHASTTTDYCDTCGTPIAPAPAGTPGEAAGEAAPAAATGNGTGEVAGAAATPAPAGGRPCPGCGEPVLARFCEECGYDVESGTPGATATVSLVLGADRHHWDRMVGEGEPAFPTEAPTLTFVLEGDTATLGRIRAGAPVDVDLALTGATADPAVSHHQCEFRHEGGVWTVRDLDSANGTWVNDATAPLAAGQSHTLADGDRLFVGAWTCLTVRIGIPAA